jgi:hypothetical protein
MVKEPKSPPEAKPQAESTSKGKSQKVVNVPVPKAPPMPPGTPTVEQITEFTKSLDKRTKEILNHPELILGMNDPAVARKTKFLHEGSVDELLGELLERLESPQEFMLITIKREPRKRGGTANEINLDMHNWPSAAVGSRLRKAASIADNRYQQGGDI